MSAIKRVNQIINIHTSTIHSTQPCHIIWKHIFYSTNGNLRKSPQIREYATIETFATLYNNSCTVQKKVCRLHIYIGCFELSLFVLLIWGNEQKQKKKNPLLIVIIGLTIAHRACKLCIFKVHLSVVVILFFLLSLLITTNVCMCVCVCAAYGWVNVCRTFWVTALNEKEQQQQRQRCQVIEPLLCAWATTENFGSNQRE